MSETTHKTLFSVIQTTDAQGHSLCHVEWHPEILALVDENGEDTDPLIDFAEELLSRETADEDDPSGDEQNPKG